MEVGYPRKTIYITMALKKKITRTALGSTSGPLQGAMIETAMSNACWYH